MYPADSERASPAQDKAKLQREYRAKEAVAIAELQKLLRDISLAGTGTTQIPTRITTIVQATETIRRLHFRNAMYQGLHGPPPPVPDHSAADFNSHLAQVQHRSTGWRSCHSDLVDERHQLAGRIQHAPVVHSSGVWNQNPPVPFVMPERSSLAGDGMSCDESYYEQFIYKK